MSVVRHNLMTSEGYSPYCGVGHCFTFERTHFDGEQFVCPECGWRSKFESKFIAEYKIRWDLDPSPIPVQDFDLQLPWWLRLDFSGLEEHILGYELHDYQERVIRVLKSSSMGWSTGTSTGRITRSEPEIQELPRSSGESMAKTFLINSALRKASQVNLTNARVNVEPYPKHQPKTAPWGKKQRFQPGSSFKGRKS